MGFLSPTHFLALLILLVVVLIIWGPGKLPDVGAGMGRAIREFRKASSDTKDSFQQAVSTEPAAGGESKPAAVPPPPPAPAEEKKPEGQAAN